MKNKPLAFITSFLITLPLLLAITSAIEAEERGLYEQQKITSHLLINLFMEKVDHGNLVVFEHILTKADLQSHQVSYVHNIVDDSLLVRLCFKLKKQILVPNFSNFYVDRITVETDKIGNIIQMATHVSPLSEEKKSEKQ